MYFAVWCIMLLIRHLFPSYGDTPLPTCEYNNVSTLHPMVPPYSVKLSKEKTFAYFEVLLEVEIWSLVLQAAYHAHEMLTDS